MVIGMKKKIVFLFLFLFVGFVSQSMYLLIPMDETQKDHLKSYGIAFWILQRDVEVKWLLNYRGGSFLIQYYSEVENECVARGVSFLSITDSQASGILNEISQPDANQDAVSMNKAPRIAVYSFFNK